MCTRVPWAPGAWAQQWLLLPLQSSCSQESWCTSPPYPGLPEFPRFTPEWKSIGEPICREKDGDATVENGLVDTVGERKSGPVEKVASMDT